MALALQRVFYNLQTSSKAVTTTALTKSFGWDGVEAFVQHDVQEFSRVLMDNLEAKMRKSLPAGHEKDPTTVNTLFEGAMKSYIRCTDIEYEV